MSTSLCNLLIAICITFAVFPQTITAQKKKDLEKERKKVEKEIEVVNELLGETRTIKEQSLNELKLLKKQINLRQSLVETLRSEVLAINRELYTTTALVDAMHQDISDIKEEYKRFIVLYYKNLNRTPMALYVFGAGSLSMAFDRMRYIRRIADYRKVQVSLISRTVLYLKKKELELEYRKIEKLQLLSMEKDENEKLVTLKKSKNELLSKIKKKEKDYEQTIKEKTQKLNSINGKIKDLINSETSVNTSTTKPKPEEILPMSGTFEKNKNSLPWPLPSNKGTVTLGFGNVEIEDGIYIDNTGIDISTTKNQQIRAIFKGKVTSINKLPEYGSVVIVQHGNYRSVYANLDDVLVKKGQELNALDPIGTVRTDKNSGESILHFELYKDRDPLNPLDWLVNKN